MTVSVSVLFVGGPLNGEQRVLPHDQHEYEVSESNTLGGWPEIEDGGLLVRDGRYVWRIGTVNPRKFDWRGWKTPPRPAADG